MVRFQVMLAFDSRIDQIPGGVRGVLIDPACVVEFKRHASCR
jgi:hypothetical protein